MVFKTLITTFLLLVVYSFMLKGKLNNNRAIEGQHQWQDNTIKAQNYLYDTAHIYDNVIIGSSLSCRIVNDKLPQGFYNLAFGGQGIFDGLEVIMQKAQLPKKVFIETNFIKRIDNIQFTQSLFQPFLFDLRKKAVVFQEKSQPSISIGNKIAPLFGQFLIDPFTQKYLNPIINKFHFFTEKSTINKEAHYQQMINGCVEDFNKPFVPEIIDERFIRLKKYVNDLNAKGTEVVFFEMPMHELLDSTVQMKAIRQLFYINFPESKYKYLDKPVYANYKTTDGLHLGKADAIKFTDLFITNALKN